MDRATYAAAVEAVRVGKRLPDGVYLHVDALQLLPSELRDALALAQRTAQIPDGAFNVVKFGRKQLRLSLLSYPTFFDEAYPGLACTWIVDLANGRVKSLEYAQDGNIPVLHRKETMLPTDHPRLPEYAALTEQAEKLGLFSDATSIGTRAAWEARLARIGYAVDGHRLVERSRAAESSPAVPRPTATVHRHRTALQRYSLSSPMQALFRHGFVTDQLSVFDYGCGRGDDLRILGELKVPAAGWDPHFAADRPKQPADVVNIGFVINVIEDQRERAEALRGAYALARRVLAVAALIGGRTVYEENRLYSDGVLTSRGTFQKFFQQQELRQYIEAVLGREPVAVGPGLFFVFRDDDEEQNFLASRQTLARCKTALPRAERAPRQRAPSRWDAHTELLEDFWRRCLELGRLPRPEEYARVGELRTKLASPKTVLQRLVETRGSEPLDEARLARMDDILVYLALNTFEQRKSRQRIAPNLRPDILAFWGAPPAAQEEAKKLLFAIAEPGQIFAACEKAASSGLGYLDGAHSLTVHRDVLTLLPALLRVYVQCAGIVFGEFDDVDLLKLHVQSGKVTLLRYVDFDGSPLPALRERVKINLRRQAIDFFPGPTPDAQLCFPKSRYLAPAAERLEALRVLEEELVRRGIETTEYGCHQSALDALLAAGSLEINPETWALSGRKAKRRTTKALTG